jgi:uncharacterized protein (TIGR02421 family)
MTFTDYILLDQKLCQLAAAIETNLLSYVNPQNIDEQKTKFFEKLSLNEVYEPKFTYAPRNPLYNYFSITPSFDTHRNELKALLGNTGRDSLGLLFEKKILDLFERMELVKSVGTPNFPNNSAEYYGSVSKKTLKYAKEILGKKVNHSENKVSFVDAKKIIETFLKKKKLPYKVIQRDSTSSKFSVNIRSKEIFIGKDVVLTVPALKRLIAHEIEAHIYRYENGLEQPYKLLARGLSKETLETEEGLAVIVEQKEGINVDAQLYEYAGRVLAISIAMKKSFYETFIEMRNYFSDDNCFNLVLRAKRGTYRQSEPGAFTKDSLYLQGFMRVGSFLEEHKIEDLYFGRYSIYDQPLVKDIDGLVKPKFLPDFLKK